MSEISSQGMMDLMALDVSQHVELFLPLVVLGGVLSILVIVLFIRYHNQPVRKLYRQLLTQQMTARQTAHQIAQLTELDSVQNKQLEKIRFGKAEPTSKQVLNFMQQLHF